MTVYLYISYICFLHPWSDFWKIYKYKAQVKTKQKKKYWCFYSWQTSLICKFFIKLKFICYCFYIHTYIIHTHTHGTAHWCEHNSLCIPFREWIPAQYLPSTLRLSGTISFKILLLLSDNNYYFCTQTFHTLNVTTIMGQQR